VSVETWPPTERLSIEAREVNPALFQQRAAAAASLRSAGLRKRSEVRHDSHQPTRAKKRAERSKPAKFGWRW